MTALKECSVVECAAAVTCGGMCNRHYRRWKSSGNPHEIAKACRECSVEFRYRVTKGVRRFICDACVESHKRLRDARYSHRQSSAAAGNEPEFLVRLRAYQFRSNIRRYGITPEDYDALLDGQQGRCAVCTETPDPEGRGAYARLHIDHDHMTGTVRGLLCGRCNQGVGYFRDDPARLRAAALYLDSQRELTA